MLSLIPMGCGISRFEPRVQDDNKHGLNTIDDDSSSVISKNNARGRLLFPKTENINRRISVVSSRRSREDRGHQRPARNIVGSESNECGKAEAIGLNDVNAQNENQQNYGGRSSYRNHEDGREEEEGEGETDGKLFIVSNNSNVDGDPGLMFIGSPSFREYCSGAFGSNSDDHNVESDHIMNNTNTGNNDTTGREERKDNNTASNEGSGSVAAVVLVKKTRAKRRFRKVSPVHKHTAIRNLINVASCYHPNNNINNSNKKHFLSS